MAVDNWVVGWVAVTSGRTTHLDTGYIAGGCGSDQERLSTQDRGQVSVSVTKKDCAHRIQGRWVWQ